MGRLFTLLLLLLPAAALANDWQALRQPGAVAVMRHALAPGSGDPPGFTLGDCSTQRTLDAAGRAQARAIGAALRARGISFDHVFTSQWCRCRETARLLDAGPVTAAPALNSFFQEKGQRPTRTRGARTLMDRTEGRRLLVTHQVNISALTGRFTRSGEILVIRMKGAAAEVLGSILIAP